MKPEINIEKILLNPGKRIKILLFIFISCLIPVTYMFVYYTGGIKYVFSHSMYLPIILSGIIWGVRGGSVSAVIGGIALGPFMPLDVATGENQMFINWGYRIIFFLATGVSVGLFSDLLKKYIRRIHFISLHNRETSLPNLSCIDMNSEIKDFMKGNNKNVICLLWNNIDDIINCFGYDICISIVQEIDRQFRYHFHKRYRIVYSDISRLFAIVESPDPELCLDQIKYLVNSPVTIKGIPFYTEFSLGLAVNAKSADEFDAFQKASIASSYSRNTSTFASIFDESKILLNERNLMLLGEFPDALKKNQISVYYQPKINLKTGKPFGMEALIRWHHPDKGLIAPDEFIPLLEESDLINPLTEFVLEQALNKLEDFIRLDMYPSISINISPINLQNPRFLERIIRVFDRHRINSELIEFEITEAILVRNPEYVNFLLNNLKNYKIILSIDDFGTGYSSLSYLSRFPIDIIKIDKFFISQMNNSADIFHIVEAAIALADKLELKVVAEGIEDALTEQKLIKLGCGFGQGYFYAKPMDGSRIIQWFGDKTKIPTTV